MERNTFWQFIDEARQDVDDIFEIAPALSERLLTLEPDEIISFGQHMADARAEAYRWDLWAVAYIVNGGCADDGFEYFRGWLIAQGHPRFQAASENPEIVGDWAEPDENECEDILYAAQDAYESRTGEEFPYDAINTHQPSEPAGAPWGEEQLEALYPELCGKFF